MSVVHVAGAGSGAVGARAAGSTLRAERAQLVRWRRLLRARLDLVVAALAPPDPLCGTMVPDALAAERLRVPRPEDLVAAVSPASAADPVELMHRLRELDRALAAYADALDEALITSAAALDDALGTSAAGLHAAVAASTGARTGRSVHRRDAAAGRPDGR